MTQPDFKYFLSVLVATLLSTPAGMAGEKEVPVTEPGTGTAQLEQRLDNIERTLQSQGLLDMYQQMQRLQEEVNQLRGQLEVNNHELEKLRAKQRDLYNDLDSRLQSLRETESDRVPAETGSTTEPPLEMIEPGADIEAAGERAESGLTVETIEKEESEEVAMEETAADETTTETATEPSTEEEPPLSEVTEEKSASAPDPIKAQAEYQQAFRLLKQAKYDQAIAAFDTFVRKYPDSQYADNAHYWMGEAFYVNRDFEAAITEYMKLVSNYPDSQKTPNGLLKIGYSYLEMGKNEDAKKALEDLIKRFPDSSAARDAENRLQRSKSE